MGKIIICNRSMLCSDRWEKNGIVKFKRVSRWIKIQEVPVTPRHSLADYAEEGLLSCFRHNGKLYALGQFVRAGCPYFSVLFDWEEKDGAHHIAGADCTEFWNPLYVELDEYAEYIRLYERLEDTD